MKKVITLSDVDFESVCKRLINLSEHSYSMVIAIASGGIYVAEKMGCVHFISVNCSRNNKKSKGKKIIQKVIKILPKWINNILRNIEHKIQLSNLDNVERNVYIDSNAKEKLSNLSNDSKILIVDDAVDSGKSFIQTINEIKKINQHIDIKSAAIVITDRKNTQFVPDFYIYENVLIRFPWALDA